MDRLGRTGYREEAPDRQGVDGPHRHPADDARAARAEGRLRVRRSCRDRVPEARRGPEVPQRQPDVEKLGAMWKQINASFGQFSMDTLCASTGALASNTAGDTTYANTENALASLGAQRDGLADQIRLALWNAEFGNQKIDPKKAKDWIKQGQGYLDQAAALCGKFVSSTANAKELDKVNHIVVIYEENHSFDNLYGGWEGVNGLSNADEAHTTQVNEAGNAYTCLKQDDVNLQDAPPLPADLHRLDGSERQNGPFTSAFTNAAVHRSTTTSRRPTTTCPSPLVAFGRPTAGSIGTGSAGWLHARPRPPLLPGAVPARWRRRRTATSPAATRSGLTMGYYDTQALPIYKYLHAKGHPDYAIADDFFQAAFGGSFLNHQWLIAAAAPPWAGALQRRRDADDLPLGRSTPTGCRTTTRSYASRRSGRRGEGPAADRSPAARPRLAAAAPAGLRLRQLRRQHDAAVQLAVLARHRFDAAAAALQTRQRTIGDRADRRRRRLGVVLGRLGQRRGQHDRPGLYRTATVRAEHADRLQRPERRSRAAEHEPTPGRSARTACSSSTTSRSTTSPTTRRARPAGRTSRTRLDFEQLAQSSDKQDLQPQGRQLHQADRRGERASRLRERARRERPPRRPLR